MFSAEILQALSAKADEYGIDPAALFAIAEIESGGRAFASIAGRKEPLIRFEGHYFDRRLSGEKRDRARRQGLASPAAGAIPNPVAQAARWQLVEKAAAIDRKAAYESVSWGIGQVMGAHWAWLGFASIDKMVATARSGVDGQAELMLRYIGKAGLLDAIRRRDWKAFAKGYNGPSYRKNRYDTRIAEAFRKYGAIDVAGAPLRKGNAGALVRELQHKLADHGHPLAADGIFGAETERSVRAFQEKHGLTVDGIAGPATMKALETPPPFRSSWLGWVRSWLGRISTAMDTKPGI